MNETTEYLRRLSEIKRSGSSVKETSYYGTIESLFNSLGKTLKPRVRTIINIQNRGAGLPDGGFFTQNQFQQSSNEIIKGQMPERGAIEIKGTSDGVKKIADSEQIDDYLKKYRQVLVTNYREFLLVRLDENSQKEYLESFSIGIDEKDFWRIADNPKEFSKNEQERFSEFLKRVMLSNAPITKPEDVAWFLASYARDAKARIESVDISALSTIRTALEDSLGIKFEGEKGEDFFRSTLVQTLFYGIFSAWVLWHKRRPTTQNKFRWKEASWELRVPMISVLFDQIATSSNLKQLNLVEVLDWTGNVLNRVERPKFFASFAEDDAVQYFYEPFLEAFDPNLRKALGVWYTPPEIVRYMVERVDQVLRDELGLLDGLADESVYVLDPACGTGAYLVEVLRRINRTLAEKGEDALRGQKIKSAVKSRVFGFEILPAPFVVSHLQIGLLLEKLGVGLSDDKKERAGVYLTNSLTGWDEHSKKNLPFPEFETERDNAERVKRETKILVVLGNPPYNGLAGVAIGEERELSNAYRTTNLAPAPQGQGLNELYVRFFRMAERRIAEMSKKGIVCYISNYSWLEGLSHTGMRESFIESFDKIWIDNLNGDKFKTGKRTPYGKPDPSVFSTKWNREGIQVGTAVALMVRHGNHKDTRNINYRNFWGKEKLEEISDAAQQTNDCAYNSFEPKLSLGLGFFPSETFEEYFNWALLPDLFPVSFPGVKTSRDDVLVSIDRESLVDRMEMYFDSSRSHEEIKRALPKVMNESARFDAKAIRNYLMKRGFSQENIVRYVYRPFDVRWLYWEGATKLLDEKRADYFPQVFGGNFWITAVQQNRKDFDPPIFLERLGSLHLIERGANLFPLYLATPKETLYDPANSIVPNLGETAQKYLEKFTGDASELFFHSLAILHSAEYRNDHKSALRQNFPRIPLPVQRVDLISSALLGRRVADLLDTEIPVSGVTAGNLPDVLRTICIPSHAEGLQLQEQDLKLAAKWGYAGKNGITMPGKGRTNEREYSESELEAMAKTGEESGLSLPAMLGCLGEKTFDVFLNDVAYWRNVPENAWNYYIGGYQVLKKWLSYREFDLLGRALKLEEISEVTNIIRRISAILLIEPMLNENYRRTKENFYKK